MITTANMHSYTYQILIMTVVEVTVTILKVCHHVVNLVN